MVTVDLDPQKLLQRGISGADVVTAVNAQNVVQPQGTAKIGDREYDIELNGAAKTVDELNDVPVKVVNGAMVYLRDVAYVHDGAGFQINISRRDGQRGVLMVVLKHGAASTLDVVGQVRAALPKIASTLPEDVNIALTGDQSIFVRAAITGVLREAVIAALLTAALILLFLGSWRSTLVVAISIPLSILTSLVVLSLLGQTINMMTLGGSPWRSVSWWTMPRWKWRTPTACCRKANRSAIRSSRAPADRHARICRHAQHLHRLRSHFFSQRGPGFLFRPLAEAVVFAMLASYFLSRTLVPTLVMYTFRSEGANGKLRKARERASGFFRLFHLGFEAGFEGRANDTKGAGMVPESPSRFWAGLPGILPGQPAAHPAAGVGPVSQRRCRPNPAARARAGRNAHRGDGGPMRTRRRVDPQADSAGELNRIVDNVVSPPAEST